MTQIDQRRIGELLALLGDLCLLALGTQLAEAIDGLAAHPPEERAELLHRLSGSAATLGFPGLANNLASAGTGAQDISRLSRQAAAIAPSLAAAVHEAARQR